LNKASFYLYNLHQSKVSMTTTLKLVRKNWKHQKSGQYLINLLPEFSLILDYLIPCSLNSVHGQHYLVYQQKPQLQFYDQFADTWFYLQF